MKLSSAWAIRLAPHDTGGHRNSYAGILYFGREPAPYLSGGRTALFRTRREARMHLATRIKPKDASYQAWPNARVERVRVTIETEGC
jgi:hypothetical protein